jgi:hypothetical protein
MEGDVMILPGLVAADAVNTTSASYHVGQVIGGLVLATIVVALVRKALRSRRQSDHRNLHLPDSPMASPTLMPDAWPERVYGVSPGANEHVGPHLSRLDGGEQPDGLQHAHHSVGPGVLDAQAATHSETSDPLAEPGLPDTRQHGPVTYVPPPYDGPPAMSNGFSPSWHPTAPYPGLTIPARRETRRGYWIAAVMIVVLAAAGLAWRVVDPHGDSQDMTLPAGTGVSPQATTATPPAGPGNVYRSAAGHFAVRLLQRPTEQARPGSANGLTITTHIMAETSSNSLVEGADISPGIPASAVDSFLRGEIDGIASSGALTLEHQNKATFHGRPAREAEYHSSNGLTFSAVAVIYGSQRNYVLLAPSGPAFVALENSFVALP